MDTQRETDTHTHTDQLQMQFGLRFSVSPSRVPPSFLNAILNCILKFVFLQINVKDYKALHLANTATTTRMPYNTKHCKEHWGERERARHRE